MGSLIYNYFAMTSYKSLDSVAHNFAHSFLSLMNYCDGDYVVMHILAIATQQRISKLTIDVLRQELDPPQFATAPICKSLSDYCQWLPELLHSQNCQICQIQSFVMEIQFDTKNQFTNLSRQGYACHAKIVDDRGKLHQKTVLEWWRY